MTTMILRDFKPILDLYSEHMPEERITGSKIYEDFKMLKFKDHNWCPHLSDSYILIM